METIGQLFDLGGQVAVVTGGGVGIGQASCFRLAEAGASVVVTDIDLEAAQGTADIIAQKGGRAHAIYADAGSLTDAEKTASIAIEVFGRLDILVNNAGIYFYSRALELTEQDWDRTIDTNVKGMFFYSQAAAVEMSKAGRGGRIVNIASIDGMQPQADLIHYDTSKGAVIMLTKALALELASQGILVNAIAPGGIMRPDNKEMRERFRRSGKSMKEVGEAFLAHIPLGHMGEPDDIAKAVLFLASHAADYITGSLLVVDGGYLLS